MADSAPSMYTPVLAPTQGLTVPPAQIDTRIPAQTGPTVSPLDVVGGRNPGLGQPSNPLELVNNMAATQQKLNEVKLFNQTFAARQKAGQIMATAPDVQTGLAQMQKDPQVSAFAPELTASVVSTLSSLTSQQGEVQRQGFDAFTNVVKGLPAVIEDPGQWKPLVQSTLALSSPQARPGLEKSLGYLQEALTAPGPDGQPVSKAEQVKRLAGWSIAGGMGGAVQQVLGTPGQLDLGGQVQPGMVTPSQGGPNGEPAGGFTPSGQPVQKTLAPQLPAGPGGVTMAPVGGQYGTGGAEPSGPVETPQAHTLAGDGKPLVPEGVEMRSPAVTTGLGGMKVLSPAQQAAAVHQQDEWATVGLRSFNNANQTMGLLSEMDRDYDTMAKGGGFLVPGTAADLRGSFAKLVNTVGQITGDKPEFDPSKVGSIEQFQKDTRRMGLTVLTTMLGNQREAAQTINNITEAVPGMNNTYLGGKILIGSIRAATQRAIDQRNFENAWQAQNQGNLTGAEEAFNAAHPAVDYANQVLASFGLDKNGFQSPQAVLGAVQNGYLTRTQAAGILKKEFPAGPGQSKGK